MKKALLLIAASMFVLAGCQKEESVKESTSNNVIHIGVKQMGPATKVAANDIAASPLTFKWEDGDEVTFYNFQQVIAYLAEEGEMPVYTTYKCIDPTSNSFVHLDGPELSPSATYSIVYPSKSFEDDLQIMNAESVIPIEQNYRYNQIPRDHHINGEGVSGNDTEFTLNSHTSMIHFRATGTKKIKKIEFQARDNNDKIVPYIVLNCGDGVQLSESPTDFYMDIAGGAFRLVFYDVNQEKYIKSTNIDLGDYYRPGNNIVDFEEPFNVDELPNE